VIKNGITLSDTDERTVKILMRNLIEELVEAVRIEYCNTIYTIITGEGNGEHQYCLGQYGEIEMTELAYQLFKDTQGEYRLEGIRYAKNGYGFTHSNIFCHCSKLVGTTKKMEEFDNYQYFMIHTTETEKGLLATWFCPIENIDEKSFNILKISILHILEKQSKNHVENMVRRMEAKAKEMLLQQKIKEAIGCECHWKYADNWKQGYQNQYIRVFDADNEITYEDIIKVINIIFGDKALDTTRDNPWYTEKINRISVDFYSNYDDTNKTSSRWFWYHHDGTCD